MHLSTSFAAFLVFTSWSLSSKVHAAPVSSCIIATPAQTLVVGRPYQVQFTNCRGTGGTVKLRSGNPVSLKTEPYPACTSVTFSTGTCIFTPKTAGQGFVFSAVDQSGLETFSGQFSVIAGYPSTPQTQPAAPVPAAAPPQQAARPATVPPQQIARPAVAPVVKSTDAAQSSQGDRASLAGTRSN